MLKVLCFGDSNIFGYVPEGSGLRYDKNTRWSGVLSQIATDFHIIEAGCNNRCAFTPNPSGDEYCGLKILSKYLTSDIDIVIIALGINDLQFQYNTNIQGFEKGLQDLVNLTKQIRPDVKIVLASPSKLNKNIFNGFFKILFNQKSIDLSEKLAPIYEKTAKQNDCYFVDLDLIAKVSDKDGLHYEASEHKAVAEAIKDFLYNNFC